MYPYIDKCVLVMNSLLVTALVDIYCKLVQHATRARCSTRRGHRALSCCHNATRLCRQCTVYEQYQEAADLFCELDLTGDSVTFIAPLTAHGQSSMADEAKALFTYKRSEIGRSVVAMQCIMNS
jgi:hypothetical protein